MLSLLLLHIIITVISLLSGFLFYHFTGLNKNDAVNRRPVVIYLVTGLITVTAVIQIAALFIPINEYVQAGACILLIILLIAVRKAFIAFLHTIFEEIKKQPLFLIIAAIAAWLLVLLLNAGPVMMDDSESYHIQSIKWIKEYGSVPGLVHLHQRFAFNSSWFSTIAFFDIQSGHLNYYTALNGLLSTWLAIYFITLIASRNKNIIFAGMIMLLACLLSWPLIRGNAATSNYDYITTILLFILFLETIRVSAVSSEIKFPMEWLIWPAYLFTVRITNFPILILPAIALFFLLKQKEYKTVFVYTSICLFLVIPFLIRNVVLSGYLFYPSLYADWFPVDWKADTEKTKELLRYIKYYNRVSTGILPLETTKAMPFFQWIKAWVKFMPFYDKIIFYPGIAGLVCFPFIMKKISFFSSLPIRLFIATIALQVIAWFIIAPDSRFIYGCLLIGIFILLFSVASLIKMNRLTASRFFPLALTFIILAGFIGNKIMTADKKPGILYPAELPSPVLRTITIGNISCSIPEKVLNNWNPRCYDTKLPCLYEVDPRLEARGNTIADGFRLKP